MERSTLTEPIRSLREAARSLYDSFGIARLGGPHPYIQAIGEGADAIHVYLARKVRGHERPIPESWEGWPVRTSVIGRIVVGPAR
jgi:hypothetical protein